jgi:hypothetical protein
MTEQHVTTNELDTRDPQYLPANPHTTDPNDWAHAFLVSGDVTRDAVCAWFQNAMLTARNER